MATRNPIHPAPTMKGKDPIGPAIASALVTIMLGLALWFGLDALGAIVGKATAEAVALLVFVAASEGLLWRVISGR